MKIYCLQHDKDCPAGSILLWAQKKNHSISIIKLHQGQTLPTDLDFDWLIILGGDMNVYQDDKYQWLKAEKEFIKKSVCAGKIAIGFCLGGQLLADVLGGKVTENTQIELGWHKIFFNDIARKHKVLSVFKDSKIIFQWHKDTFSRLPQDALLIAENEICKNQGFIYKDNVFAFQFHLEVTEEIVSNFASDRAKHLFDIRYAQSKEEILEKISYAGENISLMFNFLDALEKETS
jgi:GMP synthase-like glutamine amidotransferase